MKIIKTLLFGLVPFTIFDAAAQNVSGTVRSADGEALIGASVYWLDTSVGTACVADGEFTIHRVKGYDSEGAQSGYRTSAQVSVINNTAPGTPGAIRIPSSISGDTTITISWDASYDAENNVGGYIVERSTNGGSSWSNVYKGNATSTTNTVPFGDRKRHGTGCGPMTATTHTAAMPRPKAAP